MVRDSAVSERNVLTSAYKDIFLRLPKGENNKMREKIFLLHIFPTVIDIVEINMFQFDPGLEIHN